DVEQLNAHTYVSENIIMHNGVVGEGEGDLSDTQCAVRDYAFTLLPYMKDVKIQTLLTDVLEADRIKGSRWWMATGANYYLMGDWVEDKATGLHYSNNGYLPVVKKVFKDYKNYIPTWNEYANNSFVCEIYTKLRKVKAEEYMVENDWDWDKWFSSIADVHTTDKPITTTNNDDGNVSELFDSKGKIMALVDHEGNILWEEEEPVKVGYYTCPDCKTSLDLSVIVDGFCPNCYAEIVPKEGGEYDIVCPGCKDTENIVNSTFD
ncbi:unnamed protein product, partial [marine sediment metagenome]